MPDSMTAADLMVRGLVMLRPEDSVQNAIEQLVRHRFSGAPVTEGESRLVGVFSEKCCLSILSLAIPEETGRVARDLMQRQVVTLRERVHAIEAIGQLLHSRISGAPIVADDGSFHGVFSERNAMRVVLDSAYDQVPVGDVGAYMDPDPNRVVSGDAELSTLVRIFLATPYRRLVVVENGRVGGLISRRDVIAAAVPLLRDVTVAGSDHEPSAGVRLSSATVATFMDRNARTIEPERGLLDVAHLFLTTNFRRLPVVSEDRLVGQVSRRDLLAAANRLFGARAASASPSPLYLSGLSDSEVPAAIR